MKRTNIYTTFYFFFIFCAALLNAQSTAVSPDGVNINFDLRGTGEPAIVFVHGWANSKSIWDFQMEYFSKNYTAVAVDLAGFGKSGSSRADWTIDSFAGDVTAVVDEADLSKVVLVGFSMGTMVASSVANKIPGKVIGVVLVEGMRDIDKETSPEMAANIEIMFMDLIENPDNEKLVKGGFYKHNQEEAFKRVLAMLEGNTKTGWRESLKNSIDWNNNKRIESLENIKAPVTIINVDNRPTNTDAINKYIPSAEIKIISDSGHTVMWDKTDEFNKVLDETISEFLKNQD